MTLQTFHAADLRANRSNNDSLLNAQLVLLGSLNLKDIVTSSICTSLDYVVQYVQCLFINVLKMRTLYLLTSWNYTKNRLQCPFINDMHGALFKIKSLMVVFFSGCRNVPRCQFRRDKSYLRHQTYYGFECNGSKLTLFWRTILVTCCFIKNTN